MALAISLPLEMPHSFRPLRTEFVSVICRREKNRIEKKPVQQAIVGCENGLSCCLAHSFGEENR